MRDERIVLTGAGSRGGNKREFLKLSRPPFPTPYLLFATSFLKFPTTVALMSISFFYDPTVLSNSLHLISSKEVFDFNKYISDLRMYALNKL